MSSYMCWRLCAFCGVGGCVHSPWGQLLTPVKLSAAYSALVLISVE